MFISTDRRAWISHVSSRDVPRSERVDMWRLVQLQDV